MNQLCKNVPVRFLILEAKAKHRQTQMWLINVKLSSASKIVGQAELQWQSTLKICTKKTTSLSRCVVHLLPTKLSIFWWTLLLLMLYFFALNLHMIYICVQEFINRTTIFLKQNKKCLLYNLITKTHKNISFNFFYRKQI